jgi:hypothetical protein
MPSANEYQNRVAQILGSHFSFGKLSLKFTWETPAEAKAQLNKIHLMQKELRLVKKDISITMKAIRSTFVAKKTEVGKGFGAGVMTGLFGKKAAGRSNAIEKENLRRRQVAELSPYEAVARTIDDVLVQLDKAKIQIETSLDK